jgi:hypothetical protein
MLQQYQNRRMPLERCDSHSLVDQTSLVCQQEAGVSRATPRSKWPPVVLRRIVGDLSRTAPRQLLAQELWAGSASSCDHMQRCAAFTTSSAVMSVVGPPSPLWGIS